MFKEGVFFQGMLLGGSLIVAIGAQNAFVLAQGIKRQRHVLVATICSVSDTLLIAIGVAGFGAFIAANESVKYAATIGGVIFLCCYGLLAGRRAFKGSQEGLRAGGKGEQGNIVLITLGLTFLNPHVYLDTIVLMGSISSNYLGTQRYLFGLGAAVASFFWFFSLSFFGTFLAPLFSKTISWRILDCLIACIMFFIAYRLATLYL